MHFCGCRILPHACTQEEKPVVGVRLVLCKCTAGRVSPECAQAVRVSYRGLGWHLALTQLQRPELAPGVGPRLWWGRRGGSREGLSWLMSVNVNISGWNEWSLHGIFSGCAGCWFLQGRKLLGSSAEQVTGYYGHSRWHGWYLYRCSSCFFLAIFLPLRFARLWME